MGPGRTPRHVLRNHHSLHDPARPYNLTSLPGGTHLNNQNHKGHPLWTGLQSLMHSTDHPMAISLHYLQNWELTPLRTPPAKNYQTSLFFWVLVFRGGEQAVQWHRFQLRRPYPPSRPPKSGVKKNAQMRDNKRADAPL